jgi:hypothetical protein
MDHAGRHIGNGNGNGRGIVGEVWNRQYHLRMEIEGPDVSLDALISLLSSWVLALHLHGSDQHICGSDSLGNYEIESLITMGAIHVPARIREPSCHEKFSEIVGYLH